ncbi:hypothetical protein J6590_076938 [Homalodisca vitripennis]|nr:hypothetical protein J6590_076938 [Homalodisca vitripennis]
MKLSPQALFPLLFLLLITIFLGSRQYFRTAVCEWCCLRRQDVQSDIADTPPIIRRCEVPSSILAFDNNIFRFRQYFRTAVCEWRCLRRQEVQSDIADTPPMIRRCSHSYSHSRSGTGDDYSLNDKAKQQRLALKPENKQCFCPMGTHLRHQCRHQLVHKGVAVTWRHQPVTYTQVNNRAVMSSQV